MLTLDERGGERNRGSRYAPRAVTLGPGRPECPQAGRPESVAGRQDHALSPKGQNTFAF